MKEKNHEETKIQTEIMIALSQYGIPIRQQCGKFKTMYGGIISIGIPECQIYYFLEMMVSLFG